MSLRPPHGTSSCLLCSGMRAHSPGGRAVRVRAVAGADPRGRGVPHAAHLIVSSSFWSGVRAHACAGNVQFSYALSPVQIIVAEARRAWYHFLTTTCAIVGGVFTVAGICDGLLHTSVSAARAPWLYF